MPDTRRTLAALQSLLADNTAGDISAQDVRDFLVSVDGANSVQTGTLASIPAADQRVGDLYVPNDGLSVYRWSGSAWVPWGPVFSLRDPTLESWAWINQGSASVATTNGGIYLTTPAAATFDVKIRKKAAPGTPYTVTGAILLTAPSLYGGTDNPHAGLCWRQSSDGKLVLAGLRFGGSTETWNLDLFKMSSATSFSARYDQSGIGPGTGVLWLRLADDGTDRKVSCSADGRNFIQIHSVGRTDFLTADEVGFFVSAGSSGGHAIGATLISWQEA